MFDIGQPPDQSGKLMIVDSQGIAAANNDLVDGAVGFDALDCRLQPLEQRLGLAPVRAGVVPPEAVAAVDCAGAREHDQSAAPILLHNAPAGNSGFFPQRITDKARNHSGLVIGGQDLPQDRIPWPARSDA